MIVVPSHPPNMKHFDQWVSNHRPGLPAIRFKAATKHVSICEFLEKCKDMALEIKNFIIRQNIPYDFVVFKFDGRQGFTPLEV
jgi:hypothetical protein